MKNKLIKTVFKALIWAVLLFLGILYLAGTITLLTALKWAFLVVLFLAFIYRILTIPVNVNDDPLDLWKQSQILKEAQKKMKEGGAK